MYNVETLEKFNKDKSIKQFPGCTIIQKFNRDLNNVICSLKNEYLKYSFSEKLIFLPEDSYHMTISGLLVYNNIDDNSWIKNTPENLKSFKDWDDYCIKLLKKEYSDLSVKMKVSGFNENKILLAPYSENDKVELDSYRSKIYEKLGLKFDPNYQFHITLNYTLKGLNRMETDEFNQLSRMLDIKYKDIFSEIVIDKPELSLFDDMTEFYEYTKGRK